MSTVASRWSARGSVGAKQLATTVWVRPRDRSTLAALIAVVVTQAFVFFRLTERSFFFHDDFNYFTLAMERSFVHYLLTPILGVYPAPGDRLLSAALHRFAPLNFTVARVILLVFLAATTVALWQLVRTVARSDRWWTVVLIVPFAFSVTLVVPIAWWSAGIPIIPALFFTVVALTAWLRSYEDRSSRFWVGVAVIAEALAGAFYVKFLLIPVYLVLFRVLILPQLLGVPAGIRALWQERARWIALSVPPAAFIGVFVLSGLAGRSVVEGSRPYVDYVTTAWFRAFVPASFVNAGNDASASPGDMWALIIAGQLMFCALAVATSWRSALALRGWVLFAAVFLLNIVMVGAVRIASLGVDEIAFTLRYYPEVVLFLPIVLALGLRQGAERRPDLAWERTRPGQLAIGSVALLFLAGLLAWGPALVSDTAGVRANAWYGNLRSDLVVLTADGAVPSIVDSETPSYVMADWMVPDNRVSTVVRLIGIDVEFNRSSDPTYVVQEDGHLAEVSFRPIVTIVDGPSLTAGARTLGDAHAEASAICVDAGGRLRFGPEAPLTGERLALRVSFEDGTSAEAAALVVDAGDLLRPFRYLELRPWGGVELVDLATTSLEGFTIDPSSENDLCIARMEIGRLVEAGR